MARILALDVGEKTIGIAVTDETGTLAFPGTTILRQEGWKRDMAALRQLVAEKQIKEIVVGLPLLRDGTRGIQAEKVEAFIAVLRNSVRVPIACQDERYTTSEAEEILIAAGRKREQHKMTIDSVAACLILQSYLDRIRLAGAQTPQSKTEIVSEIEME